MSAAFERGEERNPKGHALLYFRSSQDPEEVWATYLVILPITVDVAKYVPPFLMNQMGDIGPKDLSAFAFPPAPEKLESHKRLEELAAARDDDILFAGSINPGDVPSAMMAINDAVQWYAERYSEALEALAESAPPEATAEGYDVNEVLYGLMSDSDKLNELTKLVGRLRFAVEGGEVALAKDAQSDILVLAKYFPEGHQIDRLVEAATSKGARGQELANLYLKRCFLLIRQEYARLGALEQEIRALESGEQAE